MTTDFELQISAEMDTGKWIKLGLQQTLIITAIYIKACYKWKYLIFKYITLLPQYSILNGLTNIINVKVYL